MTSPNSQSTLELLDRALDRLNKRVESIHRKTGKVPSVLDVNEDDFVHICRWVRGYKSADFVDYGTDTCEVYLNSTGRLTIVRARNDSGI